MEITQKQLYKMLADHQLWLDSDGKEGKRFEFHGDLSGADLCGYNLSNADLSGANLSRVNLIDSYLRNTNLTSVDLNGALLSGTDLSGTIWKKVKGQ